MAATAIKQHRYRTDRSYNLHLTGIDDCDDRGMPLLEPVAGVPAGLVDWPSSSKARVSPDIGVHFFVDDYRFESVWTNPQRYTDRLGRYGFVLTPDFSLYRDMPIPMQVWNVYRSRAVGSFWQRLGLRVIPTLQWSTPDSYVFSLEGLPERSTLAVSTLGVRQNRVAKELWRAGMTTAIEYLNPADLVVYGGPVDDFDFGDVNVHWFDNQVIRRLENGRQRVSE